MRSISRPHFAVADNCRFHLFVCFEVCAKTPDCSVLRFSPFRETKIVQAERKSKRRLRICRGAAYLGREAKVQAERKSKRSFADLPRRRLLSLSVARMFREADALLIGSKRGAADRSEDGIMPGAHSPLAEDRRADFVPRWARDAFDLASPFAVADNCRFHLFVCFFEGCVRKRRIVPFFVFRRSGRQKIVQAERKSKRRLRICRGAAYLGRKPKCKPSAKASELCGFAEAPPAFVIGCKNVPGGDALLIGSKRGAADRSEDGLCPVRIVLSPKIDEPISCPAGRGCVRSRVPFCRSR